MTIKLMELPEPQNVLAAAAGTAVIPRIPQGFIYKAIILVLGGTFVAAHISEIKLRLGGNVIWDTNGADLSGINAYNSLAANASFLPMHFSDRTAKTPAGERFGEIDTRNLTYSDFSLEVKLDGTQTGATLKAFAVIDEEDKPMTSDGKSTAAIVRSLVKAEHSRSASGVFDLDIPVGSDQGNIVRALHFFDPSDVLTQFGLKKDSADIADLMSVDWFEFVQDEVLRTSQANHFCYDPQPNGVQANGIDTRRFDKNGMPVGRASMRWRAGYSGAGVLTSYSDLYGTVATL